MTLDSILEHRRIPFQKHTHPATFTAQGLAQAERVSGYHVAKPVVVRTTEGYTMCVVPAPLHVDMEKVRDALGQPEARLATESEMASLFPGCELGAEPPIGSIFGLKTLMDERLQSEERLHMQGGSHTNCVSLRRSDWERLCEPRVVDIART
jgi:Ala-tRNA(Pro) deacylase